MGLASLRLWPFSLSHFHSRQDTLSHSLPVLRSRHQLLQERKSKGCEGPSLRTHSLAAWLFGLAQVVLAADVVV